MTASDWFGALVALSGLLSFGWWFLCTALVNAGAPKPSPTSLTAGIALIVAGVSIMLL